MADAEDVFDIEDLRALVREAVVGAAGSGRTYLGRVNAFMNRRPVVAAVGLVVLGASLVFALLPFTFGAVGEGAVSSGISGGSDGQQRFQNLQATISIVTGRSVLPLVGIPTTFLAVVHDDGNRRSRVRTVALASGVSTAAGYVLLLLGAQVAYGNPTQYQEYAVLVRFGAVATNALALGVFTAVGSALAGVAASGVDDGSGSRS